MIFEINFVENHKHKLVFYNVILIIASRNGSKFDICIFFISIM